MTNEEVIKEFDKNVSGYSMNEYRLGETPVIRPIMCQREDAKKFLIKSLKNKDDEWRGKIEERISHIKTLGKGLGINDRRIGELNWVLKLINKNK